jgi:hypothetical protein
VLIRYNIIQCYTNARLVDCSTNAKTLDAFISSSTPESTIAVSNVCYSITTRKTKSCPNEVKWHLHLEDPEDGDPDHESDVDLFFCDSCKEYWQTIWSMRWFPILNEKKS